MSRNLQLQCRLRNCHEAVVVAVQVAAVHIVVHGRLPGTSQLQHSRHSITGTFLFDLGGARFLSLPKYVALTIVETLPSSQ